MNFSPKLNSKKTSKELVIEQKASGTKVCTSIGHKMLVVGQKFRQMIFSLLKEHSLVR